MTYKRITGRYEKKKTGARHLQREVYLVYKAVRMQKACAVGV